MSCRFSGKDVDVLSTKSLELYLTCLMSASDALLYLEVKSLDQIDEALTAQEWEGMRSQYTLADGHAYHEAPSYLLETISRMPVIWKEASSQRVPEIQEQFIHHWSAIAGEPNAVVTGCRICPTASNSIDVVAAASAAIGCRVFLVEPTFDNLVLLLRRRGNDVHSIAERDLHANPDRILSQIGRNDILFLVDPNNPSGCVLPRATLDWIFEECARRGIHVFLDRTFRFFNIDHFPDILGRLQRAGTSFVLIDDTGKTWPTLDMKLSPLFFSEHWRAMIEDIYDEIFLCASPFTMLFFQEMFKAAKKIDFRRDLAATVGARRQLLRDTISDTSIRVADESFDSILPVEWIDINETGKSDLEFIQILKSHGVHMLSGRQFYWSRALNRPTNRIRASLLRPIEHFSGSLKIIRNYLSIGGQ